MTNDHVTFEVSNVNVEENRLADALYLRDDTLEVECLGKHDFEDFLDVDRR